MNKKQANDRQQSNKLSEKSVTFLATINMTANTNTRHIISTQVYIRISPNSENLF